MNKARAVYYLAAFSEGQIREIANYLSVNSTSTVIAEIAEARKVDAMPPMLAILDEDNCPVPTEVGHMSLAVATLFFHKVTKENLGSGKYSKILQEVFGIDETYATQLAKEADTVDDAKGVLASLRYGIAYSLNAILTPFSDRELIEENTAADDIDKMYELVLFGRAIAELNMRAQFMRSGMAQKIIAGNLANVLGTANDAQILALSTEGGDIYGDVAYLNDGPLTGDMIMRKLTSGAPISYLADDETGGIFKNIAKGAKKVWDANRDGIARALTNPVIQTALGSTPGLSVLSRALPSLVAKPMDRTVTEAKPEYANANAQMISLPAGTTLTITSNA